MSLIKKIETCDSSNYFSFYYGNSSSYNSFFENDNRKEIAFIKCDNQMKRKFESIAIGQNKKLDAKFALVSFDFQILIRLK